MLDSKCSLSLPSYTFPFGLPKRNSKPKEISQVKATRNPKIALNKTLLDLRLLLPFVVARGGADEVADAEAEGVGVPELVELGRRLPGPLKGFVALETTLESKGTVALASDEICLFELIVLPGTQVRLPQVVW